MDGGDAVEAADGEDHVVDDLDGEVAAGGVHVGDGGPLVGGGRVLLHAAHTGHAVETAWRKRGLEYISRESQALTLKVFGSVET